MEKNKIIFVIGDKKEEVREIKELLEKDGFGVIVSGEAMMAVTTAKNRDIDLIILDMHMPKNSSQSLIKSMKMESQYKKIPIVAILEKSSTDMIFNYLQYEPNVRENFVKPVNLRLLLNTVNNLLGTEVSAVPVPSGGLQPQKRSSDEFEGTTLPNYDNVRKHERLLTSLSVEILDPYTRNFICCGKVIDFSYGGVGIAVDSPLEENAGVLLRFVVSDKELRIPGMIVYKNTYRFDEVKKTFKYGVKYSIANPEEKKLLENILKKLSKKFMKEFV